MNKSSNEYMSNLEAMTCFLEQKKCSKDMKEKMLNYLWHYHGGHKEKSTWDEIKNVIHQFPNDLQDELA